MNLFLVFYQDIRKPQKLISSWNSREMIFQNFQKLQKNPQYDNLSVKIYPLLVIYYCDKALNLRYLWGSWLRLWKTILSNTTNWLFVNLTAKKLSMIFCLQGRIRICKGLNSLLIALHSFNSWFSSCHACVVFATFLLHWCCSYCI